MNPDEHKVVRITNRTDFDFTPEMGARYAGVPYMIPAGKSLLMPKPAAKLLAKHLARQVYIRNAPIRDGNQTDGKGSDRPLWTEESCLQFAEKFLSDEYEEEKPTPKTEAEIIKQKIEELNKLTGSTVTFTPTAVTSTEVESDPIVATSSYMDKAEVIAALQKRDIKFDARMNKASLEKLLTE
jgi:hypothetical protein